MKKVPLLVLSLALIVGCKREEASIPSENKSDWADVSFSGMNYLVKLERFNPPIVFEWGELITDHERREWFYLLETADARPRIDRGLDNEEVFNRYCALREPGYFPKGRADEKEAILQIAQSMTLEEYKENFPSERYISVYAAIHAKDRKGAEWVFALKQNSADDYMRSFPWEGLDEDLVAQAKVFKKNKEGRFVFSFLGKPDVPLFVSQMNIVDLSEVEKMIGTGYAVLPEGEIRIKASDTSGAPDNSGLNDESDY
jgi:hypothetical protein